MTDHTSINWVVSLACAQGKIARVWNPIRGCSPVSDGCRNCWAARVADMRGRQFGKLGDLYRRLTARTENDRPVFNGTVRLIEHYLDAPLRWRKSAVVFVGSEADLFHTTVPDEWLDNIFATMAACQRHTFLLLTKRPERMLEYVSARENCDGDIPWPLPNVWLGVSVEDQKTADERIPILLETETPAKRFVSAEPMLGGVDLALCLDGMRLAEKLAAMIGTTVPTDYPDPATHARLDWVITGGESGPGARPMHSDWARSLRDQCQAADVPVYFKQWGEWLPSCQRDVDIMKDSVFVAPSGLITNSGNPEGSQLLCRVGKKAAGRLLDGREWNEVPL